MCFSPPRNHHPLLLVIYILKTLEVCVYVCAGVCVCGFPGKVWFVNLVPVFPT